MTVSTKHGLDLNGTKAFLKYFDSIEKDMGKQPPQQYSLYFAVPEDTWASFSKNQQQMTGANGVVLNNAESKEIGGRLKQFLMLIE